MRFTIFFLLPLLACTTDPSGYTTESAPFEAARSLGRVDDSQLSEVSGLVASRKNPGAVWVHNDSGNPAALSLVSNQGALLATYHLPGAENRDWEDIALGPGPVPGETYLYVGDIGDNLSLRRTLCVYRIPEPRYVAANAQPVDTIRQVTHLNFSYPQEASDAETLLLDPIGPTLYVLTKETSRIRVFALQPDGRQQTAQLVATHPYEGNKLLDRLVAGDISADGTEVLLKTYEYVFYWHRADTTVSIPDLLATPADTLPYFVEPQGEAIGFAADGSGYYTLSEKNLGADIHLLFYPRASADSTSAEP